MAYIPVSAGQKGKSMKVLKFVVIAMALAVGSAQAGQALLDQNYRELAGKRVVNLQKAYAGKVLLVVNTASKCGFTPQFESLEAMHARYKGRGFAVLGFPSNDFMGQDPGSEKQIQEFCTLTYGVKFPMFEKVHVKGADATPLYKRLASETGQAPGWNFHKYLIDRNGRVVANFGSRTAPTDPSFVARVEALLDQPVPEARN
jgi:glutathione peroxidase